MEKIETNEFVIFKKNKIKKRINNISCIIFFNKLTINFVLIYVILIIIFYLIFKLYLINYDNLNYFGNKFNDITKNILKNNL